MSSQPIFDPGNVSQTQFAVALLQGEEPLYDVPVSPNVKDVLKSMLMATLEHLGDPSEWTAFDCADQQAAANHLTIGLDDPLASKLKALLELTNVTTSADALSSPAQINFYLARFTDAQGVPCVGVRKASQFKGPVGKSFLHLFDGQLTMVGGDLFKLDTDFDFLIFPDVIVIYRTTAFERIAEIEAELAKLTPGHIQSISVAAPFLDLSFATAKSKKSVRMRRILAGLKSRNDLSAISPTKFVEVCRLHNIPIVQKDGKWMPEEKHEMRLLEMLDRRLYLDPLVDQDPEHYRALSRVSVK